MDFVSFFANVNNLINFMCCFRVHFSYKEKRAWSSNDACVKREFNFVSDMEKIKFIFSKQNARASALFDKSLSKFVNVWCAKIEWGGGGRGAAAQSSFIYTQVCDCVVKNNKTHVLVKVPPRVRACLWRIKTQSRGKQGWMIELCKFFRFFFALVLFRFV